MTERPEGDMCIVATRGRGGGISSAADGGWRAAARPATGMHVEQLERWLSGPSAPVPSLGDLAAVFGLAFDAPADIRAGALPHRLRFTLAVLRDTFPDDDAVRRWLRAPAAALGGARPLDLLFRGEVERLEALAVQTWGAGGPDGRAAAAR